MGVSAISIAIAFLRQLLIAEAGAPYENATTIQIGATRSLPAARSTTTDPGRSVASAAAR